MVIRNCQTSRFKLSKLHLRPLVKPHFRNSNRLRRLPPHRFFRYIIFMKAIKYKIKPVTDKIFALEIPNDWDRAMVFLRSQEFYESKESQFRGKDFDIWDYMKWYAENMSGSCSFSYPNDWAAYNLPISVIVKCLDKQKTQLTPYDIFMDEVLGSGSGLTLTSISTPVNAPYCW